MSLFGGACQVDSKVIDDYAHCATMEVFDRAKRHQKHAFHTRRGIERRFKGLFFFTTKSEPKSCTNLLSQTIFCSLYDIVQIGDTDGLSGMISTENVRTVLSPCKDEISKTGRRKRKKAETGTSATSLTVSVGASDKTFC